MFWVITDVAQCFLAKISNFYQSQIIQGGLQAQLGPTGQSAPQPVKEVDETLKLRIHQVLKQYVYIVLVKLLLTFCNVPFGHGVGVSMRLKRIVTCTVQLRYTRTKIYA